MNIKASLVALTVALLLSSQAAAATKLRNICRLKGQEENTLQGLGLVVGLNGTGAAGDGATMRAMARAMELLGSPVSSTGRLDTASLQELRGMKNAALVIVTAKVPATGARRGEKLDCTVSAINGKSLMGGQLAFATLQGPNVKDRRVFALCSGLVQVDDATTPTVGRVHGGCQLEQDIFTPFVHKNGFITLVLDKNHASFHTAAAVASRINADLVGYFSDAPPSEAAGNEGKATDAARALDATNILVRIPNTYRELAVEFAAIVLETTISDEEPEARVVVNPRTGSVVISGDVRIGDVVVVHNNTVVEATGTADFTPLSDNEPISPSLDSLVRQLKQLKVPVTDVAEIIVAIERDGKLHGKLIIE